MQNTSKTPVLKQSTIKFKIKPCALSKDDPLATATAVEPVLTPQNAVGRFVRLPSNQWPGYDHGGWIGKVVKMTGKNTITIQMHDGKQHFDFQHALQSFSPLSA